MGEFGEFNFTNRMVEAIGKIAANVVDKIRPLDEYGTVQTVDYRARTATVLMQGDSDPVSLPCADFVMPLVGDMVRVSVKLGKLKIVAVEQTPDRFKTQMQQDLIVRGKLSTYAYSASVDDNHGGAEGLFVYDVGVGPDGTGRAGLVAAISAQGGTDEDGFTWSAGFSGQSLSLKDPFDPPEAKSVITGNYNPTTTRTSLTITQRGTDSLIVANDQIQTLRPVRLGSGPAGSYYYEEFTQPDSGTQVINNATVTTVSGWTSRKRVSDYVGTQMASNGIWTAPADGVYTFTFQPQFISWVAGSRLAAMFTRVRGGVTRGSLWFNENSQAATITQATSGTCFLEQGSTMQANVFQGTGAARQLATATELSIYRNP